jgi:hypothetical protein
VSILDVLAYPGTKKMDNHILQYIIPDKQPALFYNSTDQIERPRGVYTSSSILLPTITVERLEEHGKEYFKISARFEFQVKVQGDYQL